MRKAKDIKQIIRLDGKNCFMEVMNSSFGIGKVQMNFIQYNIEKQQGERYEQQISIYMDIDEFLVFVNDVLSGKMQKLADIERAKGKQYCSAIYTDMGGISAKTLESRGKKREDEKSLSRQFKLIPGAKAPFMIQAECGAGEESDTGLIVPKYGKPEQVVRIPLQVDDLKRLVLAVKTHIQAYLTSVYVAGWE